MLIVNINADSMRTLNSRFKIFLPVFFLAIPLSIHAQDYRAIHGSSYAGSLAVGNNPASIVYVPYSWDFTPLAFQYKYTTNAVSITDASYLPPWTKTEVKSSNGTFKRYLLGNLDMKLLNARIRLKNNDAIAFGISGRAYLSANTSTISMLDSIDQVRDFMGLNIGNTPIAADGRANMWTEIFGTYARTITSFSNGILNAGVTLKLNYGLAGGFLNTSGLNETAGLVNNQPGYYLTNGVLEYGYSANQDVFDSAFTFKQGLKDFFNKTFKTVGLSLGAEYIIPADMGGDPAGYGYSLKIGVSILDLGYNKYEFSQYSRSAVLNKGNVSDSLIDTYFSNIVDPASMADSLQIIAGSTSVLPGNFKVYQPGRLVINVDKNITGNFYVNGELTLPISAILGKTQLIAPDMNLATLTPRYETSRFGIYFPFSLNTKKDFWVGGAIKAGPFLMGFHNLSNIFAKDKLNKGGAYMALTFRFGGKDENIEEEISNQKTYNRASKQLKCPPGLR